MSRLLRGTTAAAGLVAMAAAALAGQTPDEQTRLTRLARPYEDLAARVLTAADAGAPRVDSVTLGGILILTDSIESPVFRQALESFRRSLTEGLGDSALPLLTDARITVRFVRRHYCRVEMVEATLCARQ